MKLLGICSLLLFAAIGARGDEVQVEDATVVDFHIKMGTEDGPWNTLQNPIVVHVGDILRLHNDDDIDHWLHTPGTPCIHGTDSFGPGETYDCVIIKPHHAAAADCYDHNIGPQSQVYIEAD